MKNKTISEALKLVPAYTELYVTWDYETNNGWVVAFTEDTDPKTGETPTTIVAAFSTKSEAFAYIKAVYDLDAQLSQND